MSKEQLFIILNCFLSYLNAANSKNYGLLKMKVESIELCRGPKRRDCCIPNVSVQEDIKVTYDLFVKEDFALTSGKVLATAEGKEVLKWQMKKPCDNFLIRTFFRMYLNISDNCAVPKGHYVFTVDFEDISKKYYDGRFLYGNLTIRSIFAGNECNFFCTMMNVVMMPR